MGNASRTEHMYILYTWQFSVLPRDTELTQGCTIVKDIYRSLDILLNFTFLHMSLFSELLLQRYLCFWISLFDKKGPSVKE